MMTPKGHFEINWPIANIVLSGLYNGVNQKKQKEPKTFKKNQQNQLLKASTTTTQISVLIGQLISKCPFGVIFSGFLP